MKRIIVVISMIILATSSCDKGFEELNQNPLAPTEVSYGAIFNEMANSLRLGWNRQLFIHNEILYDVTEQGVVTAQTFGNIDAGTQDVWGNYYTALRNARQLDLNLDALAGSDLETTDIVKAQSKILMAYKTFQMLDLFGDIPYSEAGQAYTTGEVRPAYDDDRGIYLGLLDDLRSSSDFLIQVGSSTTNGNPYLRLGSSDALFNDNLDRWIRFSNSMLLKYLVRIYHKEPQLVNEGVANLINGGYTFLTVGQDVVMSPRAQGWSNLGVNWSFREHNRLRMGTTMWNYLTENDTPIDPRLGIFFETNNDEEWVPFPQVAPPGTPQSGGAPYNKDVRDNVYSNKGANNIYSPFNFYLVRDEQDIPEILMTSAEVKFIFAEVFLKGIGVSADPFIASFRQQEGMLASMEFWQNLVLNSAIWDNQPTILTTGELFQVTEHPRFKLDVNANVTDNMAKIYAQRWVDYFRQPWEAFALIRQTDLLPREKPANTFYRFQYPSSEQTYNFDNWSTQSGMMGGDMTDVKIWWME